MTLSTLPAAPLVRRFPLNAAGRDLVVGDVHGCFSKLSAALDDVGFNPDAGDRLFLLGDLVDRGPESAAVLDWLARPGVFAIRGNHEEMAESFAAGVLEGWVYVSNGGGWFVGMTPPERLAVLDAFAALPVAIELETPAGLVGLVHADCPDASWPGFVDRLQAGGPVAAHATAMALWGRTRVDSLFGDPVAGVAAVLVGHTPVERVTSLGNVLFLDTGAWLQGGASRKPFVVWDAGTMAPAVRPVPNPPAD